MIRITSGTLRGRTIKSPNSELTHPMGAREKLALFNMLSEHLLGAKVLDAYAGSGALGIEAMSRGASNAVFVEKDAKTCKIIRENLKVLGLDAKVIMSDVSDYHTSDKYDIIIVDPPYDKFDFEEMRHLSHNLQRDGVLLLSHPGDAPKFPDLTLEKTRKYANAHISVYVKY